MINLVEKAKFHFYETFENSDPNVRLYDELPRHVEILEKWGKHILKLYPKIDEEILMTSIWLHDIGQLVGKREEDHAIRSERESKRFLNELNVERKKINKIAHCVRAHRCKDVQPKTKEAKTLAAIDSASHLTDIPYINMLREYPKSEVLAKLERDSRDMELLPELKKEMSSLLEAWKGVLKNYPEWMQN